MKRFGHGLLTLVVLVVTTCTVLRAEGQQHEKKAEACPMHSERSDNSAPASQTCANCLSSHFVSESKVHFAVAVVAILTPLPVVDPEISAVSATVSQASAPTFAIDTSPAVLRI